MTQLLKDVLFETVENSYTLRSDLYNLLNDIETPATKITEDAIELIANFVNQNYTQKK